MDQNFALWVISPEVRGHGQSRKKTLFRVELVTRTTLVTGRGFRDKSISIIDRYWSIDTDFRRKKNGDCKLYNLQHILVPTSPRWPRSEIEIVISSNEASHRQTHRRTDTVKHGQGYAPGIAMRNHKLAVTRSICFATSHLASDWYFHQNKYRLSTFRLWIIQSYFEIKLFSSKSTPDHRSCTKRKSFPGSLVHSQANTNRKHRTQTHSAVFSINPRQAHFVATRTYIYMQDPVTYGTKQAPRVEQPIWKGKKFAKEKKTKKKHLSYVKKKSAQRITVAWRWPRPLLYVQQVIAAGWSCAKGVEWVSHIELRCLPWNTVLIITWKKCIYLLAVIHTPL
jgi:hypothetical protein